MPPRRGGVPAPAQPPAPEESTRTTRRQAAALATDNIPAPPAAGGRLRAPGLAGATPTRHKKIPSPWRQGQCCPLLESDPDPDPEAAIGLLLQLPPLHASRLRGRLSDPPPTVPYNSTSDPWSQCSKPAFNPVEPPNSEGESRPPVRNFSDDSSPSSSESDPLPVPQPRRVVRARIQPLTALHTDTEEESAADNRPFRSRVRPTRSRQPPGSQASSQCEGNQTDAWTGYQIDQAKYAWAGPRPPMSAGSADIGGPLPSGGNIACPALPTSDQQRFHPCRQALPTGSLNAVTAIIHGISNDKCARLRICYE
ncbi:hypothetical protein B0H10DRAFT_1966668 [Mycena sp. CBHHK59/15]|nr:hypothetical protein B0H10DRAFT_1966668 [Mycena sp. CBHHK59/15]